MSTFTIIMFGLATLRIIAPFMREDIYESFSSFITSSLLCITIVVSYIWFLHQFIQVKWFVKGAVGIL